MNELSFIVVKNKGSLVGELTRHQIHHLTTKSGVSLIKNSSATLDLVDVTKVDTAGLAWLFYLLEQANSSACQLTFLHLPEKLNKLIELSCVEGFLPTMVSEN